MNSVGVTKCKKFVLCTSDWVHPCHNFPDLELNYYQTVSINVCSTPESLKSYWPEIT